MSVALVVSAAGCRGEPAPSGGARSEPPPAPGPSAPVIDPGVEVGDTVAGLRVVSSDLKPVQGAGEQAWVGEVLFEGAVELTGSRRPHASDPESEAVCFFPDAVSSRRLPRLAGDERVSWLCFEGQGAAAELAGSTSHTVTIDDFRYAFSFSDVFNTARLVSVEGRPGP